MNRQVVDNLINYSDSELAKKFLMRKTENDYNSDYVHEQIMALVKKKQTNKDGSKPAYPKFASLDSREIGFLEETLVRKNEVLARDSSKYELKLEEFVKMYEKMLNDNWEEFENARIERDKKDLQLGKNQYVTFLFNAQILNLIMKLISSIDLTKINENTIGV